MNAFANTLFSILLSWVKSLAQTVWNLVSGGGTGGFLVWLGDHWLPLVVVLCLCGVAVDLLIWLLRWRPDLVWRTKWRHFWAKVRGREMRSSDQRAFYQGYQDALSVPEEYSWYPENEEMEQPAPLAEAPWWEVADVQPALQDDVQHAPVDEGWAYAPAQEPMLQPRRRRSEKYQKLEKSAAISQIREKWRDARTEDDGMLDGLPPIVDKDQAFHAPVYPKREYNES